MTPRWPTCARCCAKPMDAGALGMSSGLDYPPGAYATTDELAALTGEAARHGGFYHTHVRYRSAIATSIRSARRSRSAGAATGPVHITHFYHRETHPGGPGAAARPGRRRARRRPRRDVRHVSVRMGLDPPADPDAAVDPGGRAGDRSRSGWRRAPRASGCATELRARGAAYTSPAGWADVRLGYFASAANLRWEGLTLADVMNERGVDAVDAMCDLLLDGEPARQPGHDAGRGRRRCTTSSSTRSGMFGTDSTFIGAKPSPRTYGSYPRVLGEFVRERAAARPRGGGAQDDVGAGGPARPDGSRPARDGYFADVVVFDPETVAATPRTTSRGASRRASST